MSDTGQESTTPATPPAEQRTPLLTQAQVDAIAKVVAQQQPKHPDDPPEWASGLLSATSKLAEDVSRLKEKQVSEQEQAGGEAAKTPDGAGTQPAEQTQQERVFTQAELGRQLSAARNAEREKFEARIAELEQKIASQPAKQETKPTAKKTKTNDSDEPPEYVSSILDQIKNLSEAVGALKQDTAASKFEQAFKASGLPESMRDFAEAAVKGSGADDIASYLEAMKANVPTPKPEAKTDAPKPVAQSPNAVTGPPDPKPESKEVTPDAPMPGGTPATEKDFSGVIDPMTLSRDEINHLKNTGKFLPLLERWHKQGGSGGKALFPKKR